MTSWIIVTCEEYNSYFDKNREEKETRGFWNECELVSLILIVVVHGAI